jgi:phage tail protein X
MAAAILSARQGATLDQLIWREAGLGADDIGRILVANPGLADAGAILPLGTRIAIPVVAAAPRIRPLIQLWD